jgi:WD40 repeat protein
MKTGKESFVLPGTQYPMAFARDGKHFCSTTGKEIIVWDLVKREQVAMLKGHTSAIRTVAFSPDGKLIATASEDAVLKFWDATTYKQQLSTKVKIDKLLCLGFSPDSSMVVVGGNRGIPEVAETGVVPNIRFLDVRTGNDLFFFPAQLCPGSLSFSADGKLLAVAGDVGYFWLYDIPGRKSHACIFDLKLKAVKGGPVSVVFGPDGKTIAEGDSHGKIKLWLVPAAGAGLEEFKKHFAGE